MVYTGVSVGWQIVGKGFPASADVGVQLPRTWVATSLPELAEMIWTLRSTSTLVLTGHGGWVPP